MALAAEEGDGGHVVAAVRNGRGGAEVLHAQEGDDLVERAFRIELQLGVLVGDAQRLDGRLADVAGLAVQRQVLAEALGPQLGVPVADELEGVGVGHHHGHVHALAHGSDHQAGLEQRRVLPRIVRSAALVHGARAGDHGADVHTGDGGCQQADRAQLGEAAAHAVRDVEGLVALFAGDLDEEALFPGGGDDDMAAVIVAHGLFQQVKHDEVLAHGLGRAAGFGDDVEAGGLEVDDVQQRRHALGIDVVLDVEARAAALLFGKLVVVQVLERLMHRRGAKGGAADAKDDKGLKLVAHARGGLFDGGKYLVLIVGQRHPDLHALAATGLDHGVRVAHGAGKGLHLRARDAVFADVFSHHRIEIEMDRLHTRLLRLQHDRYIIRHGRKICNKSLPEAAYFGGARRRKVS